MEVEEVQERGRAADGVVDQRAVDAARRRPRRRARSRAPTRRRRSARARAAARRGRPRASRTPVRSAPRACRRAEERMLVAVDESRNERGAAEVDDLRAPRRTGRAHLGVVADRDDRPGARPRRRSALGRAGSSVRTRASRIEEVGGIGGSREETGGPVRGVVRGAGGPQGGVVGAADVLRDRAARVEAAADGDLDGVRRLAGEDLRLRLRRRGSRCGTTDDERRRVRVLRVARRPRAPAPPPRSGRGT